MHAVCVSSLLRSGCDIDRGISEVSLVLRQEKYFFILEEKIGKCGEAFQVVNSKRQLEHTVEPVYNGPVYSGDPVYNGHCTTSQKLSLIFTVMLTCI